jgi:DNA-binding NtrC family response regulator
MNREAKMSSAINWGADGMTSPVGGDASALVSQAALEHKISALRDVALNLLSEVESLGRGRLQGKRNLKLHEEVQQFEIDLIRIALDKTGGSQTQAARLLGVKLTTLNTKIKRYGIECAGQRTDRDSATAERQTADECTIG